MPQRTPLRTLGATGLLVALAATAALAQAQEPSQPYYAATPLPVAPQPPLSSAPVDDGNAPWRNVVPEPGVVVSGDGTAYAPGGYAPPPVVYGPPPAVYAPPVYVQPAYAWPQPYIYPPVGISLGIGYSRGWHHRGWHGGWRGHRGWR